MNTQALLSISNLSLTSPVNNRSILEHISYQVNPGDFVVILGGNGSGKSSLLKTITQHYTPSSGSIMLENKNINTLSVHKQAQDIAVVTQDTGDSLFYGFTVAENCLMYESIHTTNPLQIAQMQERQFYETYLASFSVDLANKMDTYIESLSGGQRQTLALALCLRHHPKLLLLDEHTSALDPKTAHHVMQKTYDCVISRHITCLMTTHDLNEALIYGNRLLALKAGKIVFQADKEEKKNLTRIQLLEYCY